MADNKRPDTIRDRRRRAVQSAALSGALLALAAAGALWLRRTFWPQGFPAALLSWAALFYSLLLLPLAVSLRSRLKEIDKGEEDEARQY